MSTEFPADKRSDEMRAKTAMIKVLAGNDASLGVARRLGAKEVDTEPSEAGGVLVVFRLALTVGEALA